MLSRHPRLILLLFGILVVSAGGILVASASQTTLITAERAMRDYWRTSYDILVRPADTQSPIEEKYGLVEANHLSGLWGGITFEQYEAIKSIPGLDVVAPIATIGYVVQFVQTDRLGLLSDPGTYVVEETLTIDNGAHVRDYTSPTYYYVGLENPPSDALTFAAQNYIIVNPLYPEVYGAANFSFLLAGIDPPQEAALAGLDQALIEGEYLKSDESLIPRSYPFPAFPGEVPPELLISVPSLINITPYVHMDLRAELKRLLPPSGDLTLKEIMARGGIEYLAALPAEVLGVSELESEALYRRFLERIEQGYVTVGYSLESAPSPIIYQEAVFPFSHPGLTLDIVLPERKEFTFLGDTEYRLCLDPRDEETRLNAAFNLNVRGVFNIEHLPQPTDVNRAPLETYFPPVAILRYDEQGNPVDPPRELRPTRSTCGYIQSPPLVLTTLEAARTLRGDAAISAIRVRVALDECPPDQPEACTLTNAAQRKIEAIAIEIQRQTGLDVDIMVGSSPTRMLVHVPEIGYVEEQWIQKGVNLVYKRGIQTGNWLLMGTLLLAGGLFTLDMAWAEVLSRRRVIALQKALGWRSRTVFTQIVGQVLMIGAMATITGTLIAMALIRLLGWETVPLNLWIALPLIVMVLCVVGSLLPAWSASRVLPIAELQRGGVQYQPHKHNAIVSALWSYAWSEIKRRRVRSVLTGMGSALSAALLTLLLGVTLQQRGMLGGTLLGEFILVNVQGYHYAIVGIGLGLAFLSTFNGLLGSILERRREIGVLKAMGWRTVSVARLFILQGLLLGIVGGFVGALVGGLVYLYLYRSVSSGLLLAILCGLILPGLVGALAALYPARLAARVPPAEAVRYE